MKPLHSVGTQSVAKSTPGLRPILVFTCLSLALTMGSFLTGCSSKKTAFSGKGSPSYTGHGPIPKGGGRYKVGSPYKILNKWYTPRENPRYDAIGTASWYGPKFHKRKTANGEWFDMNQMTAAHPTLPLPVFVRVTNLRNGRAVTVRVNDRGPYSSNREIDLSRAAARKLGFIKQGTARVRVQYLGKAPLGAYARNYYSPRQSATRYAKGNMRRPRNTTTVAFGQNAPQHQLAQNRIYGPQKSFSGHSHTRYSKATDVSNRPVYIQAASYSNLDNAIRAKSRLSSLGPVEMSRVVIGPRSYYRVRVGPLHNTQNARKTLNRVVDAGHADARIIN